ncbi:MAG: histidinol-phosphate transaminase [Streptosporangiaceae bacterium]
MAGHHSPHIAELTPYTPGMSPREAAAAFGVSPDDVVKLGSGENPFGPSPAAVRAIAETVPALHRYPEWTAADLRRTIAATLDISPERIVCGAGETELISCLIRAFAGPGDEVLMHRPTFPIYHLYAEAEGRAPVFADGGDGPVLDVEDLAARVGPRTRLVFLTSPHNPSGRVVRREDLRHVRRMAEDALVVMDEAYIHFADGPSAVDLLDELPNLVVLRTFSKAYGLAGLRVGFGIASEEIVRVLMRVKPTWNVGPLQVAGAVAALDDHEHVARTAAMVRRMRETMVREIDALPAFRVVPGSQANFVLVRVEPPELTSTDVFRALAKSGLIVKDGSVSYLGLADRYLRIDVGTEPVVARLVAALRDISEAVS